MCSLEGSNLNQTVFISEWAVGKQLLRWRPGVHRRSFKELVTNSTAKRLVCLLRTLYSSSYTFLLSFRLHYQDLFSTTLSLRRFWYSTLLQQFFQSLYVSILHPLDLLWSDILQIYFQFSWLHFTKLGFTELNSRILKLKFNCSVNNDL